MSSDACFLEIWKSVKQRNPTPKEKKSIAKATEMGKAFRDSGLWDQLLSKYGEERGGRIWDLLVAIYEGDSSDTSDYGGSLHSGTFRLAKVHHFSVL